MATHSSVLAWRIPGMGEPGGLPSLGSHRVGHDWSDLAAAAAHVFRISGNHTWGVTCTVLPTPRNLRAPQIPSQGLGGMGSHNLFSNKKFKLVSHAASSLRHFVSAPTLLINHASILFKLHVWTGSIVCGVWCNVQTQTPCSTLNNFMWHQAPRPFWVPVSWDYTDCLSVKPSALLPTFKEQKTLNLSQKLEKFGALGFLPQMEHRIGRCWEAACISSLGLPWQSPQTERLQWQKFIFSQFSRLCSWDQGVSRMALLRPQSWGFLLNDEHPLPISSQGLPSVLACF